MDEPSKEVVDRIKAQHPDRSLHLIELYDESEHLYFVMTGPNRVEYQKFNEDVLDGREAKNEKDKSAKLRAAVENAALAQIRWPDREEVKALFTKHPAIVLGFADQLNKTAGESFEVRSKKL